MVRLTRRYFVGSVGAAVVVPATSILAEGGPAAAPSPTPPARSESPCEPTRYLFFNAAEARLIEAACERLIPADDFGPGALGAGVPSYLDKQLAGAWGAGERLYRSGPWQPGTPSQGCQSPFTPALLFHTALGAIDKDLGRRGSAFADLPADAQDAYLRSLESGALDLGGVPSAVFFDMLLKMTVEGFFSDPVCGGSRDRFAWRLIGFAGAYADHYAPACGQETSTPVP